MTTNNNTPTPTEGTPFPYETDARTNIAALRAIAADFITPEPRSLTTAERRIVTATPRTFVQKAANFGQTVQGVGEAANADFNEMLDGEAYANAYDPLIDELESLRQIVRKAVALRRLKSARGARSIYRIGKSYVLADGGDNARTHVQEMKKALHRRRRATVVARNPDAADARHSVATGDSSQEDPRPRGRGSVRARRYATIPSVFGA